MSIDYCKNTKAFLQQFPLKKLNGQQKFLILAAKLAEGDSNIEINISELRQSWLKSIMNGSYNSSCYSRAEQKSWVNTLKLKKGFFKITMEGFNVISDLIVNEKTIDGTMSLQVFDTKSSHSIDKYLRNIFSTAQKSVCIADSWIDESIFDTILDSIPNYIKIQLLYMHIASPKKLPFEARKKRFSIEFSKFCTKKYRNLHDRFFIIDDVGYIIGPSLKDAATKSPALLVTMPKKETAILQNFFNKLWLRGK